MKTKSIWILLFTVMFNLMTVNVYAQKNKPPKRNPPNRNQAKNAPFDGGVTVLIGAGMAYALKRAFDNKRKSIIKG